MDVPTDRLLLMLIVGTALGVFAVGWGFIETEAAGDGPLFWVGLVVAFLAILAASWVLFGRIDEKRDRRN